MNVSIKISKYVVFNVNMREESYSAPNFTLDRYRLVIILYVFFMVRLGSRKPVNLPYFVGWGPGIK